jgi:hypothetical protein
MKIFWMIWVTALTAVGLSFGGYLYVHARNEQAYRKRIEKDCSEKAMRDANADTWDIDKVKTEYSYRYSDCIRSK